MDDKIRPDRTVQMVAGGLRVRVGGPRSPDGGRFEAPCYALNLWETLVSGRPAKRWAGHLATTRISLREKLLAMCLGGPTLSLTLPYLPPLIDCIFFSSPFFTCSFLPPISHGRLLLLPSAMVFYPLRRLSHAGRQLMDALSQPCCYNSATG